MSLKKGSFYPKNPMLMIISIVLSIIFWAYVKSEIRDSPTEINPFEDNDCTCAK